MLLRTTLLVINLHLASAFQKWSPRAPPPPPPKCPAIEDMCYEFAGYVSESNELTKSNGPRDLFKQLLPNGASVDDAIKILKVAYVAKGAWMSTEAAQRRGEPIPSCGCAACAISWLTPDTIFCGCNTAGCYTGYSETAEENRLEKTYENAIKAVRALNWYNTYTGHDETDRAMMIFESMYAPVDERKTNYGQRWYAKYSICPAVWLSGSGGCASTALLASTTPPAPAPAATDFGVGPTIALGAAAGVLLTLAVLGVRRLTQRRVIDEYAALDAEEPLSHDELDEA